MMTNEMSFRELARRIHPDLNPHIENAGDKMLQAARVKNEPHELWKLAMRWKVSDVHVHRPQPQHTPRPVSAWKPTPPKAKPIPPRATPVARPEVVAQERTYPIIGDMIRVRTKGNIVVRVARTTPKRVYFFHNGVRQYVLATSVKIVPER